MNKKKIVVIGTGVGGAAASALLSKEGHSVTVLERSKIPGGKSASYERDGFICDMGVHYTARGENGPLGDVAKRVAANLDFIKTDPFLRLVKGDKTCDLPLNFTTLPTLIKLAFFAKVKVKNYLGIFRAYKKLISAKTEKDVEPYNEMSLKDFISKYTDDEEFHRLMDMFSGLLLVIPSSQASAGEFIWCFSTWASKASCAYPKGGFGQIAKSYLEACEKHNGIIKYTEPVTSICIEDGKLTGVKTENDFYPADIVISNAGIKKTVELAGENNFDESYVKQINSLKDSAGGITVKYALDYNPMDIPIILQYEEDVNFSKSLEDMKNGKVPDSMALFIPSPSFIDPELAPPGKHLLLAGSVVPESMLDSDVIEKMLDKMEAKIKTIFPGIEKHIIWKHRTNLNYVDMMSGRGAGDVIGLAQSIDQVGKNKPAQVMPVEGLYLVGCDAGGRGVGTEQAADSALQLFELLKN